MVAFTHVRCSNPILASSLPLKAKYLRTCRTAGPNKDGINPVRNVRGAKETKADVIRGGEKEKKRE